MRRPWLGQVCVMRPDAIAKEFGSTAYNYQIVLRFQVMLNNLDLKRFR